MLTMAREWVCGFTGTRTGLTPQQHYKLHWFIIESMKPSAAHHGDCRGGDKEFDEEAKAAGWWREAHPPIKEVLRAWCDANVIHSRKSYLVRDRNIVDACTLLIGCPREEEEPTTVQTGGTWYTIRYARQHKKAIMIIWPNGRQTWENANAG